MLENEELISKELNSAYYQIEALKNNLQKIKKKLTDLKKDVNMGDKSEEKKK